METKPIKVHKTTYEELDQVRTKGETFDNVINRLLKVYRQLESISQVLGPTHFILGPTHPASINPLPLYCTVCRQPVTRHAQGCPYGGQG